MDESKLLNYRKCDKELTKKYLTRLHNEVDKNLKPRNKFVVVSIPGTGKTSSIERVFNKMTIDGDSIESFLYVAPSGDLIHDTFGSERMLKYFDFEKESKSRTGYESLFKTYQGLMYLSKSEEQWELFCKRNIKYIVLDEAHQSGAKEWKRGVEALMKAFPKATFMGLSPVGFRTNAGESDVSRRYVENLFNGKIVEGITSFKRAYDNGILAKPHLITCYSDKKLVTDSVNSYLDGLRESNNLTNNIRGSVDKLDTTLYLRRNSATVASVLLKTHFEKICKNYEWYKEDGKTLKERVPNKLVFMLHSLRKENCMKDADCLKEIVKGAMKLSDSDVKIFEYHSGVLSGIVSKFNIQDEIFKSEVPVNIVVGVNMLNSSVHWEQIDAQFIFRHTESIMQSVQVLGRQMRLFYKKRPVIFDVAEMFTYDHAIQHLNLKNGTLDTRSGKAQKKRGTIHSGINYPDVTEISNFQAMFKEAEVTDSDKVLCEFVAEVNSMISDVTPKVRYEIINRWVATQEKMRDKKLMTMLAKQYNIDVSLVRNVVASCNSVLSLV